MGFLVKQPQGLWITTRHVEYEQKTLQLTRISETGVIVQFGYETWTNGAGVIRQAGLKIGMQFREGHQIGPDPDHPGQIHFASAATGTALANLEWIALDEDPAVTRLLGAVFSPNGQWRGYRIAGAQIPGNTWDDDADRLYFKIVVRNFAPPTPKDVHVVPMVCVLDKLTPKLEGDFTEHYVLGLGAFTVGHEAGGFAFDSEIMTRESTVPPRLEPPAQRTSAQRTSARRASARRASARRASARRGGAKRAKRAPAKRRARARRRARR